ncbi:MAG TPA: hypothetical protein VK154_02060 [Chitinophagales bacterium]|nr:hypothetical protein [Chitinophagales bacterium]
MAATSILPPLRFAVRYAIVLFALGFALGTIRTLYLAPRIGALAAVAIELPLMLLASWFYSRYLRHKLLPAHQWPSLLLAGMAAFTLLMAFEFTLAVLLFKQTPAAFAASLQTTPGMLGLLGQTAFGLIPLLQGLVSKTTAS